LLFSQGVLEDDGRLSPEGWNRQAHWRAQEIQYLQVRVRGQDLACAVPAGVRRDTASFRCNLVESPYSTRWIFKVFSILREQDAENIVLMLPKSASNFLGEL
jgi:hypothetical protein